ncbi:Abi family protein [Solibaculum intestinale]|uniref:Abi family protein n=1 Tax=Solibaculum intestinale TaxID=3133165 RepID=A0ABV1E2W4_9FIRM
MDKKKHQPPLTVEEQILNLKSIGLTMVDEEDAKDFLNDVSYFRFIKAYSLNLKEKNGMYYNGVSFEKLKHLYLFNANFRQILFPQIEMIEINLRCRVANHFSHKYGVLGYEDPINFINIEHHTAFMHDINVEINRNSKSPFVKNFKLNYEEGKIPFYALIELFSFGLLSKFYKNMKIEDKKIIANSFNVGYKYLESWIESIAYVRNICAHYGRLYNARLTKTPKLYKQYTYEKIRNNRIYSILLCLSHLIVHDRHWEEFVDTIEGLLEKYSDVNKELMGFPNNWKDYLV